MALCFTGLGENCFKKYLAAMYNCLSLQPDLKNTAGGKEEKEKRRPEMFRKGVR
jgi:hypothetical protein